MRCILANASVDDHYATLLAETEINGYDFVLYAGPQWDNATGRLLQERPLSRR